MGGFAVLAGGGCRRWGMAADVVILDVGRVKALRQVGRSKRGGSDGFGEGGTCERGRRPARGREGLEVKGRLRTAAATGG